MMRRRARRRAERSRRRAHDGLPLGFRGRHPAPGHVAHRFFVTMAYSIATIFGGLVVGVICGMLLLNRHRILVSPIGGYVQLFRCTPLLIQIIWFYYALPVVINVEMPAWLAAGLGLVFYMGAFSAEIFRGGIMSIDRGQWQAARAIRMKPWQGVWRGGPPPPRRPGVSPLPHTTGSAPQRTPPPSCLCPA